MSGTGSQLVSLIFHVLCEGFNFRPEYGPVKSVLLGNGINMETLLEACRTLQTERRVPTYEELARPFYAVQHLFAYITADEIAELRIEDRKVRDTQKIEAFLIELRQAVGYPIAMQYIPSKLEVYFKSSRDPAGEAYTAKFADWIEHNEAGIPFVSVSFTGKGPLGTFGQEFYNLLQTLRS